MVEKLRNLLDNSYSLVSNFKVSSIVITKDNKEFYGVNVEDNSLRAGTCAERNALFNMITNGYSKGDIKEINLMTESNEIKTPCFVCRQLIDELCDKDTIINCYSVNGDVRSYSVSDLCPYPFNKGE